MREKPSNVFAGLLIVADLVLASILLLQGMQVMGEHIIGGEGILKANSLTHICLGSVVLLRVSYLVGMVVLFAFLVGQVTLEKGYYNFHLGQVLAMLIGSLALMLPHLFGGGFLLLCALLCCFV